MKLLAKARIRAKVQEVIRCHRKGKVPCIGEIAHVEQWAHNHYREPCVVKIIKADLSGYIYEGNGDAEALFPGSPLEAHDILTGFMGSTQEMTQREFLAWRHDVLEHGPFDRYLNFCTPVVYVAYDINTLENSRK